MEVKLRAVSLSLRRQLDGSEVRGCLCKGPKVGGSREIPANNGGSADLKPSEVAEVSRSSLAGSLKGFPDQEGRGLGKLPNVSRQG